MVIVTIQANIQSYVKQLMLDNFEMKKLRHGLVKYISQGTKLSINRVNHLISKYTYSKAGLLIIN